MYFKPQVAKQSALTTSAIKNKSHASTQVFVTRIKGECIINKKDLKVMGVLVVAMCKCVVNVGVCDI